MRRRKVHAVTESPLSLVEFPADDPERARRFWAQLLEVEIEARRDGEGEGWQTHSGATEVGVHARGRGPGDTVSLPYFTVADVARGARARRGARRQRHPPRAGVGDLQGLRGEPVRARPRRRAVSAKPKKLAKGLWRLTGRHPEWHPATTSAPRSRCFAIDAKGDDAPDRPAASRGPGAGVRSDREDPGGPAHDPDHDPPPRAQRRADLAPLSQAGEHHDPRPPGMCEAPGRPLRASASSTRTPSFRRG